MAKQELKDRYGHKIGDIRDKGASKSFTIDSDIKKLLFRKDTYDTFGHKYGSESVIFLAIRR